VRVPVSVLVRLRAGAAAALMCVALASCHGGTPGESTTTQLAPKEAAHVALQEAIRALPGVTGAHVRTEQYSGTGPVEMIIVGVPQATAEQVLAVANTINRLHPVTGTSDAQEVKFMIDEHRLVIVSRAGALEPRQIVDDVERLRPFAAVVDAHSIDWHRETAVANSTLTVESTETPIAHVLNAIRADLGGASLVATISPSDYDSDDYHFRPAWTVSFPFAQDQQEHVEGEMAAMPVVGFQDLTITAGGEIGRISAIVRSQDAAYDDLTAVIDIIGAGRQRPLELQWRAADHPYIGGGEASGIVLVGGCGYEARDADDPAKDTQTRLRRQYDTCPR
jgi:hypothetical protein